MQKNTFNNKKDIVLAADCVAAAFYYQSYLESLGMGPEAANAGADFMYSLCLSNNR